MEKSLPENIIQVEFSEKSRIPESCSLATSFEGLVETGVRKLRFYDECGLLTHAIAEIAKLDEGVCMFELPGTLPRSIRQIVFEATKQRPLDSPKAKLKCHAVICLYVEQRIQKRAELAVLTNITAASSKDMWRFARTEEMDALPCILRQGLLHRVVVYPPLHLLVSSQARPVYEIEYFGYKLAG